MAFPTIEAYKQLVRRYQGVPAQRILVDDARSNQLVLDVGSLDTESPPDICSTIRDIVNDIFNNHVFVNNDLCVQQQTVLVPVGMSAGDCVELFETLVLAAHVHLLRFDWTKLDRTSKEYNTVVIVLILLARILGAGKDVYQTCLDATTTLDDPCLWGMMNDWEHGRFMVLIINFLSAVGSRSVFQSGKLPMLVNEMLRLLHLRQASNSDMQQFRNVTGVN